MSGLILNYCLGTELLTELTMQCLVELVVAVINMLPRHPYLTSPIHFPPTHPQAIQQSPPDYIITVTDSSYFSKHVLASNVLYVVLDV